MRHAVGTERLQRLARSDPGTLRRLTDRRRLRQARWRLAAAVAAIVAVGATLHTMWQADAARSSWSQVRAAIVAAGDIDAGQSLTASDLRVVELPAAAIPPGAATGNLGDLVGQRANRAMFSGEVVMAQRLGPATSGSHAARVPGGFRAVALPTPAAMPPLSPGDLVDLVASGTPNRPATPSPGALVGTAATIATAVEVLDTSPTSLTVVVPDDTVSAVVAAVVGDVVVPVLVGG